MAKNENNKQKKQHNNRSAKLVKQRKKIVTEWRIYFVFHFCCFCFPVWYSSKWIFKSLPANLAATKQLTAHFVPPQLQRLWLLLLPSLLNMRRPWSATVPVNPPCRIWTITRSLAGNNFHFPLEDHQVHWTSVGVDDKMQPRLFVWVLPAEILKSESGSRAEGGGGGGGGGGSFKVLS